MSTMRSWFFGSPTTHSSPQSSSRSRKRARVGLSIDSDSSDGDELPDITFRSTGTAQRERGMSDRISVKAVSNANSAAKAAPTTWALDWSMTDSSDDDSIKRGRSMSEPHVYGDDSSSLEEEAPFLPSPSDLLRGGSGSTNPSPFLLPAPRRLRYPEITVYQHNHNATHINNNHGRGTRRRTRTTEEHGRHEFWRSASLDSDDDQEMLVDTTMSTISSSPPSSPTRNRRGTRKFWTPYRLLMVLFLFATYTTFWLPIPAAPQATYSLRGSRISLDHATSMASSTTTSTPSLMLSTTSNQSRPLPTLGDSHQRGGRMTAGGGSSTNNLILARPSGTASLAYRNSESLERYYQQEAFHHESDFFFRWSWYCNVVVLSMFVVAAAREYKNRGQAVCDL
jgi:hypothetical protein